MEKDLFILFNKISVNGVYFSFKSIVLIQCFLIY